MFPRGNILRDRHERVRRYVSPGKHAHSPALPAMTSPRKTTGKHTGNDQFDLFLPYVADMPLRDQREMMERPFFSLAKSKRVKPIDYTSPDGKLWVHVSASPEYGMATIWDADILIYCASVLADMARRGVNDVPRKLHLMPYDLLRPRAALSTLAQERPLCPSARTRSAGESLGVT